MAKANASERKKEMTRDRVRKCRRKKKSLEEYENAVRSKIHESHRNQNVSTSENQTINNGHGTFNLQSALQSWVIKHRITHMAVRDLLSVLNTAGVSTEIGKMLPKDSRTLMKTPTHVEIQTSGNGSLWYNGIQTCLEKIFKRLDRDMSITLNFNFDGVPVFNSSNIQFWPILSAIQGIYTIVCYRYKQL